VARSEEAPVLVHVPLVLASPAELLAAQAPDEAPGSAGFLLDEDGPALVDGPHHPDFWIAWANASPARDRPRSRSRGDRSAGTSRPRDDRRAVEPNVILPASADGETGLPDLVVKLLRVLAPGRNPEVEVSVALAEGGWDRVRTPVAWSILTWRDPSTGVTMSSDSAVACTFIPAADDGFELFCARAGADDGPWGEQRRLTTDLARELVQRPLRCTSGWARRSASSLRSRPPSSHGP
jgi:maltokinase